MHDRLAALTLAIVCIAMSGCSLAPSTHFSVSTSELRSQDDTTQARAALKSYFNAIGSGDDAALQELTAPYRRPGVISARRIEVESITSQSSDSWTLDGVDSDADVRVFKAPVRLWSGDASIQDGERLDWFWILERGADGKWRVRDWGPI